MLRLQRSDLRPVTDRLGQQRQQLFCPVGIWWSAGVVLSQMRGRCGFGIIQLQRYQCFRLSMVRPQLPSTICGLYPIIIMRLYHFYFIQQVRWYQYRLPRFLLKISIQVPDIGNALLDLDHWLVHPAVRNQLRIVYQGRSYAKRCFIPCEKLCTLLCACQQPYLVQLLLPAFFSGYKATHPGK